MLVTGAAHTLREGMLVATDQMIHDKLAQRTLRTDLWGHQR